MQPFARTMSTLPNATEAEYFFVSPPIPGNEGLLPITSWEDMYLETQTTGVEFDEFWYESVEEGVAYFFVWLGPPRSTVLVVWDNNGPTHVECRTFGDVLVSEADTVPILAEVVHLFRSAGFWRGEANH